MPQTAVIAGVGPGLGASLAHRFRNEGLGVGLIARSDEYLQSLATDLPGTEVVPAPADISDADQVASAFNTIQAELGPVDVLVNHASGAPWKGATEITPRELDRAFQVGPIGSLLCTQQVLPDMLEAGAGTIIFTGATSAIRGRDGAIGFSAAKFAIRGMAESMARELGPAGIHVAHVIIDGQILPPSTDRSPSGRPEESYLNPDAIADTYWHLVEQDRSSWSLEVDVRPHVEEF